MGLGEDAMAASEDHLVVRLGDQEITLAQPQSYSLRWEIATAAADIRPGLLPRVLAAALGACWGDAPWPGESRKSRRPTYESSGYDPLKYGAAVIDSLLEHGATMPQVSYAGTVAFGLLTEGLFGEQEVQEAEDFFGQTEGA